MKDSARYAKVVEWSENDQCYIGSAPGLMYGGCHGDDEKAVFAELCEIVDELIEALLAHGDPLPPPTTGSNLIGAVIDDRANEDEQPTVVAAE